MRKSLLSVAVVATFSVAALAIGDIPTRYSGSFPSDGLRTNIVGTFTGKALNIQFTRVQKNRPFRRTFAGGCANISPTQTRCTGRIRGSGDDQIDAQAEVVVTWTGGKPTAIAFSK
jgi:hypothetical protein